MSKIIVISFAVFFVMFYNGKSRDICKDKYAVAYDYINADVIEYKSCVSMGQQIVSLDMMFFTDSLYEENIYPQFKSRKELSEYFVMESINNYFSPYDTCFNYNIPNNCEYVVFFSKPTENILLADFVQNIRKEHTYKNIILFNSIRRYCFIFNDANEVEKVFKVELES